MGAVIGPAGLRLVDVTVTSPILHVVSTLSLTLVLFTDAVSLKLKEIRKHGRLAFIVLGPGTLLSAAIVSFAAWYLLNVPPAAAAVLGAALSSTDPVLLRGLLRRKNLHPGVRQALRLESGLNDGVLLPVILTAMVFMGTSPEGNGQAQWVRLGMNTLLLGPFAGIVVGLVSVAALDLVRRRTGVRRDYESFYCLGVAFAAFAAGEALHGSGFLAAFAAGLTISALDVDLCDCFLEYGETTAEMMLLFTFVLFGTSIIWSGFGVITLPTLLFAVATLCARPAAFIPSLGLAPSGLDMRNRILIAWFGPRGLSSLLLVLLPVFAGISGAASLVPVCCLVVLISIVVHGVLPAIFGKQEVAQESSANLAGERQSALSSTPLPVVAASAANPSLDQKLIDIDEVRAWDERGLPYTVLDVRNDRSYNDAEFTIPNSLRVESQIAAKQVAEFRIPKDSRIITFCSCPADASAVAVAQDLKRAGWSNSRALHGGWEAWQANKMPVIRKQESLSGLAI